MPFRFRKSMKVAPGIRVNLNKGGPSILVGPKGAGVTVGSKGTHASAGVPRIGLSYSGKVGNTRAPGWSRVGKALLWGAGVVVVLGVVVAFAG
jgi:hypothetical protein